MPQHSRYTHHTDPREKPRVVRAVRQVPVRGRTRMDRRHDLFQDQVGCLVMIMTAAPLLYWIWKSL